MAMTTRWTSQTMRFSAEVMICEAEICISDESFTLSGYNVLWNWNQGKCGVCGDPWDASPRQHEAPGGMFANGNIVASYKQADWIDVAIEVGHNFLAGNQVHLWPCHKGE